MVTYFERHEGIPEQYVPWCNLAYAVLKQAKDEYVAALNGIVPRYPDYPAPAIWYVNDFEDWIRSVDGALFLFGKDPEYFIEQSRKEAKKSR